MGKRLAVPPALSAGYGAALRWMSATQTAEASATSAVTAVPPTAQALTV